MSMMKCPPSACLTIAPACADRSCGPPKPGAAYENQQDGAAGGPPGGRRGPMGPRSAHGDAVACPGGPNINCATIRDSRATRRMTTCSELRWMSHFFFWAKTDIPPPEKSPIFWFYCNSPNGYAHSNCTAILCKGVWSIRKVIVPLSKPIAIRHHR